MARRTRTSSNGAVEVLKPRNHTDGVLTLSAVVKSTPASFRFSAWRYETNCT